MLDGEDAGLNIASVLAGFQEKEVCAAFDEAACLLAIIILKLFKINAAGDADGFCGGTHGTGHEPRLCGGGELVSRLARQFSGNAADFAGASAEAVFRENDRSAAEGVGFDDVRAGLEIFPVDREHNLGLADDEILVATFELRAAEIRCSEIRLLQHGAHRAIQNQDAFAQ